MFRNQLNFIASYFKALRTFDPFVSSHLKRQFLLIVVIILGMVVTNTFIIWLIGKPFDYLTQNNFQGLGELLFFLALVIVLNQYFHYQNMYKANVLGLRFVGELRGLCLNKFCEAKLSITNKFKKGDVLTRLSDDIDLVQRFVIESPLYFISHLLTLLFYSAMLFIINWKLALLALFLMPLFFFHQMLYAKPKAISSQNFLSENGKLLAKEDEILANLRLVKAFNATKPISESHARFFEAAYRWAVKERRLNASFNASLALIIYICALLVVYFGVQSVENKSITVAELVSFLIYMGYLSVPIRGIADLGFQVQADIMAGDRVGSLLHMDVEENAGNKPFNIEKGKISLDSISFTVNNKKILQNVSVSIPAGESYAIVGESGVGKSTLVQLLSRFLVPDEGDIVIDGQSILDCNVVDLRNAVATVWQHPMLFSDSVRNNMILAKVDATDDEIVEALKAADAWEFVSRLQQGIDSDIGSGNIELSGGQKQRIQLAQAFLRNPSILILDEATSALDSQAEERVMSNIQALRRGKTTLVVTHRYSAIKHVKHIIYLNQDGTVTAGSHEDLLKTHEGYKHAIEWQSQAGEKKTS